MLRLDQIDLDAVVQGRASDRAETHRFLDVATGAVRPGWSPGADPLPGRWEIIHPTGMGGHKVSRDMADFARCCTSALTRAATPFLARATAEGRLAS